MDTDAAGSRRSPHHHHITIRAAADVCCIAQLFPFCAISLVRGKLLMRSDESRQAISLIVRQNTFLSRHYAHLPSSAAASIPNDAAPCSIARFACHFHVRIIAPVTTEVSASTYQSLSLQQRLLPAQLTHNNKKSHKFIHIGLRVT